MHTVLYQEVRYNTLVYDVTPVSIHCQVQVLRPLSDFSKHANYQHALTPEAVRKPKKAQKTETTVVAKPGTLL